MKKEMSESYVVAILLTVIGGYFDAYTYVCRDGVFANAQTGNIVRVGITLANSQYSLTIRYLLPIIACAIGTVVAMFIRDKEEIYNVHWRQFVLLVEAVVIFLVGAIPLNTTLNIIANIMISFICAMQSETFKKMLGSPFASTMCTGNLRNLTENIYHFLNNHDKESFAKIRRYFGIIATFIFGAFLGVKLTNILMQYAVWLTLIPMSIAIYLMFFSKRDLEKSLDKVKTINMKSLL